MKKAIFIITLILMASCSENCSVDSAKLSELSQEAEAIRLQLNEATTPALQNVYQLQLDQKTKEMDAVAQECF